MDSFNSKREVQPGDYEVPVVQTAAESRDWIQKWSQHMNQEQRQPIVVTTERAETATVEVKPLIAESALKQLVQLYKKAPAKEENKQDDSRGTDSLIQFQDRHKVFLKRPSQEKLDHYVTLKQHEKKKVTDDLMDVDLE